ncbi:hypothetical protein [Spiroplasma endosymbiont of Poecilobothrus nobilitatus]|uniref:hypothetical protein n=1 Tax=Spiroplasma endosymbiont of Poecilobothrus nobilitatus TaxID=1209220 RepID=UPI00313D6CEB
MKSNVENKKEKKQNGLFISWVDLVLYFIISCLLAFVCILDTVSTIDELKEKYTGIRLYILWFMIYYIMEWQHFLGHFLYRHLFSKSNWR